MPNCNQSMPALIEDGDDDRDEDYSYSDDTEDSDANVALEACEATEKLKKEGNLKYGAGLYKEAVQLYEKALGVNEKNQEEDKKKYYIILKNNIAQCQLKRQKFNNALDSALDAIEAGSNHYKSFSRAAKAFDKLHQPKLSFKTLKKGLVVVTADVDLLLKDLQELKRNNPRLESKIQETCWEKIDLRALAEKAKPYSSKQVSVESENSSISSDDEGDKKFEPIRSASPVKTAKSKKSSKQKNNAKKTKKEPAEKKSTNVKVESEPPQLQKSTEKPAEEKDTKPVKKKTVEVTEEENCQKEFDQLVKEGSIALRNQVAHTSCQNMGRALDIIRNKYNQLKWRDIEEANNLDVVAVRYIYGRACVDTNIYDNIIHAKESFDLILTVYKSVRFPAVHLGYGWLYKKLNRYEEAKKYVNAGLSILEKNLPFSTCNWPGLPSTPIEETIRDNLSKMLTDLLSELNQPLPPDAVCRFQSCLPQQEQEQTHILPSESIFLSDPDYRGHFRIQCHENCKLEYHKVCWIALKAELQDTWKHPKIPTESDFLGKACLTPDCVGIITTIDIYNRDGDKKCIVDDKVLKKITEEEKRKREEEKLKKEEEHRATAAKNEGKKKKKKRKSPSPEEELNTKENLPVKESSEEAEPKSYLENQIDYSQVDLTNAIVVKKNRTQNSETEKEDEDRHVRKKMNKKTTLSLEEFRGNSAIERNSHLWPGNVTDAEDFSSRVARGEALKKLSECSVPADSSTDKSTFTVGDKEYKVFHSRENKPLLGENFQSVWSTNSQSRSTEDSVKKSSSFSGTNQLNEAWKGNRPDNNSGKSSVDDAESEVIKESVWSYLEQVLKTNGPLRHDDPKILDNISEDCLPLIGGKDNIRDFVMLDPKGRFKTSRQYVSLLCDLKKAIQMGIEDNNQTEKENTNEEQRIPASRFNNDKAWNELKKKLQSHSNSTSPPELPRLGRGSMHSLTTGVQTDISSIDLDEEYDPLTLQQTNTELVEELQHTKDKIIKIQNDKKIEMKELMEKNKNMTDEIARLKNENQKLKDENFKVRRQALETGEKEKEVKNLKLELTKTGKELEQEQRLCFEWRTKGKKLEDENLASKRDSFNQLHRFYSRLVMLRKEQNEHTINFLAELRHNPRYTSQSQLIEKAMKELDEYAARLLATTDQLKLNLDNCIRAVNAGGSPKFDVDLKDIEPPNINVGVLFPLIETLGSSPTSQPFSSMLAPGMGAPPRVPPNLHRFNNPPPGIPVHGGIPMSPDRSVARPRMTDTMTRLSTAPSSVLPPALSVHSANQNPFAFSLPGFSSPPPSGPLLQTGRDPVQASSSSSQGAAAAAPDVARPPSLLPIGPSSSALSSRGATASPFHEGASAGIASASGPSPASSIILESSVAGKPKKSHDKLVEKLKARFNLSNADAMRYILALREKNGGKLSGMSHQDIFDKVKELINMDEQVKECCICYEEMAPTDTRTLDSCKHKFHTVCIDKWLNMEKSGNLCPMCRNFVAKVDEFPDLSYTGRKYK